jgi:hypothetical protein
VLEPDALAASLDAALVVAGARPGEAGLEDVVRRQRLEAGGELAAAPPDTKARRRAQPSAFEAAPRGLRPATRNAPLP